MDRVHAGQVFRALRREQHLRQADLARKAGLAQQTISDLECGRFGRLSVDTYCRVAEALGAEVVLTPHWRGPKLARLLDRRHAHLQNLTVSTLLGKGWDVRSEVTFNHFGDRGSVDILARRADCPALLIVEIKSELDSLEDALRTLDMKSRVVPCVVKRELGWDPGLVGVVLVLPDGSSHRDMVARHGSLVGSALPDRTVAVRRWLDSPSGELRGVWFLRDTDPGGVAEKIPTRHRVAVPLRGSNARPGPLRKPESAVCAASSPRSGPPSAKGGG
jgi:transcriptional regulator with XRE-family HTH domain